MMKPQLTLRDLFLFVALVAMGVGWWIDHARQARENVNLARSSRLWEERATDVVLKAMEVKREQLVWNSVDENPQFQLVGSNGETYLPRALPHANRLFRLITAIEAEGYRVNFSPGDRPGNEQLSLPRIQP